MGYHAAEKIPRRFIRTPNNPTAWKTFKERSDSRREACPFADEILYHRGKSLVPVVATVWRLLAHSSSPYVKVSMATGHQSLKGQVQTVQLGTQDGGKSLRTRLGQVSEP